MTYAPASMAQEALAATVDVTVAITSNLLIATGSPPNPIDIEPGTTVVWNVPEVPVDHQLCGIEFREFTPNAGSASDFNPNLGPFTNVLSEADRITGSGDSGRRGSFIYKIIFCRQGSAGPERIAFNWEDPLQNGGGLRVPPPPDSG